MNKTPIETLLDSVELKPVEAPKEIGDLPYVTHSGTLDLGFCTLTCHMLSNGERVFDAADVEAFFLGKNRDGAIVAINAWGSLTPEAQDAMKDHKETWLKDIETHVEGLLDSVYELKNSSNN